MLGLGLGCLHFWGNRDLPVTEVLASGCWGAQEQRDVPVSREREQSLRQGKESESFNLIPTLT